MKKRIISFILTVLMVVAMIPAASFTVLAANLTANGVSVESSGLKYHDGKYHLDNVSGKLLYTDGSSMYPTFISEIFTELRKVLPADKFSDEDIFGLIDDAIEIRCKLSLTIDLLIRSAYAKLAVQVGIAKKLALDLCSSNYLQLPKFVVMTFSVRDETLDKVLAELGSGIVWKDRIKFEILNDKYFGSGKKLELKDFSSFSQKIACYAWLVSEIAEFFEDYRRHVVYKIAQNFYVNNIDIEKIKQIFELSNDEIDLLIAPRNYKNF
jgi:hypothetical protein